jgi:glycosyltransferase involved in cell wall biosynthesis
VHSQRCRSSSSWPGRYRRGHDPLLAMTTPLLAVVIATRDRPVLFASALASVLDQDDADLEIIVVDDGSTEEAKGAYAGCLAAAAESLGGRLKLVALPRRPLGHGPAFARNAGAACASAAYLGFLDDDDTWTDRRHVARLAAAVRRQSKQGPPLDLYLCNQLAWQGDVALVGPIWLEALHKQLRGAARQADADGGYEVGVQDLMAVDGFCHLNTLVVRREVFQAVGCFDEQIRYEEDRELYLRLLDSAQCVVHQPAVVARHNVPVRLAAANASSQLSDLERRRWQLHLLRKLVALLRHPALRAYALRHLGYALKRVAHEAAAQGDWAVATHHAREALAVQPSLKWALFTASLYARRLLPGK